MRSLVRTTTSILFLLCALLNAQAIFAQAIFRAQNGATAGAPPATVAYVNSTGAWNGNVAHGSAVTPSYTCASGHSLLLYGLGAVGSGIYVQTWSTTSTNSITVLRAAESNGALAPETSLAIVSNCDGSTGTYSIDMGDGALLIIAVEASRSAGSPVIDAHGKFAQNPTATVVSTTLNGMTGSNELVVCAGVISGNNASYLSGGPSLSTSSGFTAVSDPTATSIGWLQYIATTGAVSQAFSANVIGGGTNTWEASYCAALK